MGAQLIFKNDADEETVYRLDEFPAMTERDARICRALLDMVTDHMDHPRAVMMTGVGIES